MAYPTKYTRQYDYVAYQNANPSRPLPADKVNADLNQAALSSKEIVDFLKTSIRADGAIANGAIGSDQLTDAVKASMGDAAAVQVILDQTAAVNASAAAAATSATNAASSAAAATSAATNAASSATAAAASASSAAATALALASSMPYYATRAVAAAATIPVGTPSIQIVRYATGKPVAPAIYIPGSSSGPAAFQEAAGNWWELDLTGPVVDIRWFPVVDGGVTDCTTAVRAAMSAAAGKTLMVIGYYAVSDSVVVPNYTRVWAPQWFGPSGAPNGFTIVTGTALYTAIFTHFDDKRGGITLEGLYFKGNNTAVNTGTSVGVLYVSPSNVSTTDFNDIVVKGCYFDSFKHNHRVLIEHSAQTDNLVNVRGLRIEGNVVKSVAGDATTGFVNTFVYLHPNNTLTAPTTTGLIYDVQFRNNTIFGVGICSAIQGIGGIINAVVSGNQTEGMGNNCDGNLTGYTYTFYQSSPTGNVPENITISGNTGDTHHNFAVYLAGVRKFSVVGNVLGGTFRPNAVASLPWGAAIAANGCSDGVIAGNALRDNYGGVCVLMASVPDGRTLAIVVADNQITSTLNTLGSAAKPVTGIEYQGDTSVIANQELLISGNIVKLTGDTPQGIRFSGGKMGRVTIEGNKISSSYLGYNEAAAYTGGGRSFSGNVWAGTLVNSPFIASTSSAPLNIANEEADFTDVVAGSSSGFIVDASTALSINGLTLRNKASGGGAFSGVGAQGNLLQGVSCPGCATAVAASSIGLAAPNWTGYLGGYVQNLNTSRGSGTTPNRYLKKGWIWDTGSTWSEDRTGLF